MFVAQKDVKSNTVTLCSDPELYKTELVAHSLNILEDISFDTPKRLFAKIRYRHTPAIATVEAIEGGRLRVRFDLPQRAIAPGQSLVLYDGDTVVGGGIIE
jgi:tRNA-specific 2-thiouridylase